MPLVNIKFAVDGRDETLSEFMCDWPNCPHVAVHVVGVVRELRLVAALCAEHAAIVARRGNGGSTVT
jgi:hypothetical protein